MKHGFLILTHLAPVKILDQVKRMQSGDHYFFIHFDKKQVLDTEDAAYKELVASANVHILSDRIGVQWGSFSIVAATIALMRAALKQKDIGYMHLMSGECLHVKPMSYVHQYFEQHNGKEFLHHFVMPEKSNEHSYTHRRLDKYHLHIYFNPRSPKLKDKAIKVLNDSLRRLQRVLKPLGIYRRYPAGYPKLYAGIAWWSLTYNACKYIVDYVDQHPDFYQRFKYVQLPDEIFFQTVIMNSPYAANVVNDNVRFQDFKNAISNANPMTEEHKPDLANENVLFARKFTPVSKELLAYLDKNVYKG